MEERKSNCLSCGKLFSQKENGSTFHYCSVECHRRVKEPLKRKCPVKEVQCQLCDKKFNVINNLSAKYCSDKCRSLARYRKLTGTKIKAPRQKSEYGKGYISKMGYKIVYDKGHPNANKKTGIIHEHILVMSKILGRPLEKGETVHHLNGIRHDNRPENLELWKSRHPAGVRTKDEIKYCIEFLEKYGYKISK